MQAEEIGGRWILSVTHQVEGEDEFVAPVLVTESFLNKPDLFELEQMIYRCVQKIYQARADARAGWKQQS